MINALHAKNYLLNNITNNNDIENNKTAHSQPNKKEVASIIIYCS